MLVSLFFEQEPVTCELGTSFRYQQTGVKRRLVEVRETCQYIPLMQNLEKLLNNQDFYQEVQEKVLYSYIYIHIHIYVSTCSRLFNHMQEVTTLLVIFVMPLYTKIILYMQTVMDLLNFNSSSIMMKLK